MKAYMVITDSGPIVILTSHGSILDADVVESLQRKGLRNSLLTTIPIGLAEQRYGNHFSVGKGGLRETDDLRVLDEDGDHVFKLFRFDELGSSLVYEPSQANN